MRQLDYSTISIIKPWNYETSLSFSFAIFQQLYKLMSLISVFHQQKTFEISILLKKYIKWSFLVVQDSRSWFSFWLQHNLWLFMPVASIKTFRYIGVMDVERFATEMESFFLSRSTNHLVRVFSPIRSFSMAKPRFRWNLSLVTLLEQSQHST